MNRLILIILISTLLSGCVLVQTGKTKVWFLCYQDDKILPNGMYSSNELRLKCDGRKQIQASYKVGPTPTNDVLKDFDKYRKEH